MTKINEDVRFLHLIDHDGTILELVSSLSVFPEHKILTSFFSSKNRINYELDKLSKNKNIIAILHATGNKKFFYNMKEKIAQKFKKFYIFLHVSYEHFFIKNRAEEFFDLKDFSKKHRVCILTPSKTLSKKFSYFNIPTIFIQSGINFNFEEFNKKYSSIQKKYIVTTCTSEEGVYNYIKGVDIFYELIRDLNLERSGLILGNNSSLFKEVLAKKVSKKNFLKYLSRSKVYIQLSRTESYNISAVYAKQMKIPIIVTDIEGHKDNIKYGFRVNNFDEAKTILKKMISKKNNSSIKKIVEKNYQDSIKRENLNNFRNSFNKLLNHSPHKKCV